MMSNTEAHKWMQAHPEITSLQTGVVDLNGQLRGKRMPIENLPKILDGGYRMPASLMGVDIWGRDTEKNELVFASGDGDGIVHATERGPILYPAPNGNQCFVQAMLFNEDGSPHMADPRQALAKIEQELADDGLTPVCAVELEFYLTDPDQIYATAQNSTRLTNEYNMVSLDELDAFDPFLNDLYAACAKADIPADAAISENGSGQFEINLKHVGSALRAADDAFLFKRLVKATARKHGFCATFMAKPFAERSGSGLHVHFSLLDRDGNNIFQSKDSLGSDALRSSVAGLLEAMPYHMAIFAPHANSYRRFAAHSHAPCHIAWGYENRTTAVRIPGGPLAATRIEHRVSGADANPYLVLAAILGAANQGRRANAEPPLPTKGDAYSSNLDVLPRNWGQAIERFSDHSKQIFEPILVSSFALAKEQEIERFEADISAFEYRTYIDHA